MCKKESEDKIYYIPTDFRPWVIYKPGTYWIYKNEITGLQDCTYVNYYNDKVLPGSPKDSRWLYSAEIAECAFSSSFLGSFTTDGSSYRGAYYKIFLKNPVLGEMGVYYDQIVHPSFEKYRGVGIIENYGVDTVYLSEDVNGISFNNVYDLRQEWINSFGDSLVISAHFVKSIGIIKLWTYIEKQDTTWTLVRWNVIQ
ncbi:MAG TPA: hypothetical protein VMC08_01010 [Bacteroidales bacterium]|nr:hypothetical protein [Bacteroidales bacterium]